MAKRNVRGAQPLPIAFSTGITRPLKTAEDVARDIVRDIVSNGLRTGDKLAAEPAMLEQYGVSRQSLREALRLLEVQGLINLRRGPGGGPLVGVVDAANFGRVSTLYYHLIGVTHAELIDAWAWAEGQIAALAASRSDRPEVREALAAYLETDPPSGTDLDRAAYVDLHSMFHWVLGGQCGNKALELTLSSFGLIVGHQLLFEMDPRDLGPTIAHEHHLLAKAVVAGNAKKAQQLAEAHVRTVADAYRKVAEQSLDQLVEWR